MDNTTDEQLGRRAVEAGLVTEAQVGLCLAELAHLSSLGQPTRLENLLVQRGLLQPDQLVQLAARPNKVDLKCPRCAKLYTVVGLPEGKTMPCKQCGTPLQRQQSADTLAPTMVAGMAPVSAPDAMQVPSIPTLGGGPGAGGLELPDLDLPPDSTPGLRPDSSPGALRASQADTRPNVGSGFGSAAGTPAPTTASAARDPLAGVVLSGKYAIQRKIGQGGMGAVYLAQHTSLGRRCAIKILPQELAANPDLVARFRREAQATAALDQPHLVTIYDVDEDQGHQYLAMEFLEGRSLDQLPNKRLQWKKAVHVIRQAALGLSAAHERGIIHRDIKPGNMMLTKEGMVKVLDFGLARLAEGANHLSRTGQVLGSPLYMSPEQAQAEELDARTDIYSLGVTLYELVTGQPPFQAPNAAAVLLKVVTETPRPPEELASDNCPPALSRVILRMMAKDRDARYPDLASCIEDLLALVSGQPIAATDALQQRAVPRPAPGVASAAHGPASGTPFNPRYAWIGGASGLVLLIVVMLLMFGGNGTEAGTEGDANASGTAFIELRKTLAASRQPSESIAAIQIFLEQHGDAPEAVDARKRLTKLRNLAWSSLKSKVSRALDADDKAQARQHIDEFLTRHTEPLATRARGLRRDVERHTPTGGTPDLAGGKRLLEQLNTLLGSASPPIEQLKALIGRIESDPGARSMHMADLVLTRARERVKAFEASAQRDAITQLLAQAETALRRRNMGSAKDLLAQLRAQMPKASQTQRDRLAGLQQQLARMQGGGPPHDPAGGGRRPLDPAIKRQVATALKTLDCDAARTAMAGQRGAEASEVREHIERVARVLAGMPAALRKSGVVGTSSRPLLDPERGMLRNFPIVKIEDGGLVVGPPRIARLHQPLGFKALSGREWARLYEVSERSGELKPIEMATLLAYMEARQDARRILAKANGEPDRALADLLRQPGGPGPGDPGPGPGPGPAQRPTFALSKVHAAPPSGTGSLAYANLLKLQFQQLAGQWIAEDRIGVRAQGGGAIALNTVAGGRAILKWRVPERLAPGARVGLLMFCPRGLPRPPEEGGGNGAEWFASLEVGTEGTELVRLNKGNGSIVSVIRRQGLKLTDVAGRTLVITVSSGRGKVSVRLFTEGSGRRTSAQLSLSAPDANSFRTPTLYGAISYGCDAILSSFQYLELRPPGGGNNGGHNGGDTQPPPRKDPPKGPPPKGPPPRGPGPRGPR